MKTYEKTIYVCDICGQEFDDIGQAWECSNKPVSHDKGVKVGDVVKIIAGDGTGKLAKVKRVITHPKSWGGERYWHTVSLEADVIDSWGTRLLTFDSYELV